MNRKRDWPKQLLWLACLATAVGCEHGITINGDVSVPAALTADVAAEAPQRILLRLDVPKSGTWSYSLGVICEPAAGDTVAPFLHDSFGCAKHGVAEAWLVPVEAAELKGISCGIADEEYYGSTSPPADGVPYDSEVVFAGETQSAGCTDGKATVHLVLE